MTKQLCDICGKKEATVEYFDWLDTKVVFVCEECCEKLLFVREECERIEIEKAKKKFHYEIEVKGESR
jgi:hypothetical protein